MPRPPSDSSLKPCWIGNLQPRAINVDKNRVYPTALEEHKAEGTPRRRSRLRQCKYLNNIVEQDHRVPKKRVWLARGYQSFTTTWRTLQGIEAVHMIQKGRVKWVAEGDPLAQLVFINQLFGLSL
jgi:transposase-like protein